MTSIETINLLADDWAWRVGRASIHAAILIAVVWTITRLLPRLSPATQCWLWRLTLLKVLLATVFLGTFSIPVLPATGSPEVSSAVLRPDDVAAVELSLPPDLGLARSPMGPESGAAVSVIDTPPIADGASLTVTAWTMLIWVVGVLVLSVRIIRDSRRLYRSLAPLPPVTDRQLLNTVHDLSQQFRIRRPERVLAAIDRSSPCLIGVLHPALILIENSDMSMTVDEQRAMVAHELAHLKRRDLIWNWLSTVTGTLFFFHPIVWIARREQHVTQEMAADRLAIQTTGVNPLSFAEALMNLVAQCCRSSDPRLTAVSLSGSVRGLKRRMVSMRCYQLKARGSFQGWLVIVAVGVMGLLPWQLVARESDVSDGPQQEIEQKATTIVADSRVQQIIAALRQAEQRIHSLGVDYAVESENYFARPGQPLPENVKGLIQDDAVASFSRAQASFDLMIDGRFTNKSTSLATSRQFNGVERHRTWVGRAIFDGQQCHTLSITINANGDTSRRALCSKRVTRYTENPLEFTLNHWRQRISDILETHGVDSVVRDRLDDLRCFKVTTHPHQREDGYRSKRVYWIDPARAFLVVRRQALEPGPDGEGWELHDQVDGSSFVEQSPSVWLPTVVKTQTRTTKVVPSYAYAKDFIQISAWRVNEELSDDVFKPDWDIDSGTGL